ncbi:MAG: sulfoxide reductase heme-binding subunit YedZ [Gammaproteobacteria bacterium]|jgi:sulfoxide reductase heme-binding subunit YedZ
MRRKDVEKRLVKPALFAVCLVPMIALTVGAFMGTLGANPVEALTHETGEWGLRLMLVTLAMTPLRRVTKWTLPIRLRRMLGLFAFFYVVAHFSIYVVFDHFFSWADIVEDVIERLYVTVGFFALLCLIPLAVTSTNGMIRRLGAKRWKQLHRLAYIAAIGGVVHFLWLVKADLLEPLIYGAILSILLAMRLRWPLFRKAKAR